LLTIKLKEKQMKVVSKVVRSDVQEVTVTLKLRTARTLAPNKQTKRCQFVKSVTQDIQRRHFFQFVISHFCYIFYYMML
jgi:hypothetical protein